MRAGTLKDRVTLQQNTPTQDAGGAPVDSWADVATVWAAIEPLTGREFFDAARVVADVTHRLRIRYRADVTEKMRAIQGSRTFDISAVLEVGRRRELHLMAREIR